MIKIFAYAFLFLISSSFAAHAADLRLGASPLATYIDDEGEPARLNAIIKEAFSRMGSNAELHVMRRAFLGSAISTGQLDGEYAFISLDQQSDNFVYSAAYLPLNFYVISKRPDVSEIRLLPQLQDSRIAVENRFVNTDEFRKIPNVKWSRNPSTFDAFRQFADERAPLLMTTALLADEFNKLLQADGEELTYRSGQRLVTAGFHLTVNKTVADSQAMVDAFDKAVNSMQKDGTYNLLLATNWLTKDVNNDGVADFVTSASLPLPVVAPDPVSVYRLDATEPATSSLFLVDNISYENWANAKQALSARPTPTMPLSLLDRDIYKKIIGQW